MITKQEFYRSGDKTFSCIIRDREIIERINPENEYITQYAGTLKRHEWRLDGLLHNYTCDDYPYGKIIKPAVVVYSNNKKKPTEKRWEYWHHGQRQRKGKLIPNYGYADYHVKELNDRKYHYIFYDVKVTTYILNKDDRMLVKKEIRKDGLLHEDYKRDLVVPYYNVPHKYRDIGGDRGLSLRYVSFKPAILIYNINKRTKREEHWFNGKLHAINAPAVIKTDFSFGFDKEYEYWWEGKKYNKEYYYYNLYMGSPEEVLLILQELMLIYDNDRRIARDVMRFFL